eukprot:9462313-Pyramimonas_sp.AAC.1
MVSRAGWGFASVNEEGGLIRGIYGNVPGFLPQSSVVGGVHALLSGLTRLEPEQDDDPDGAEYLIHIDCEALLGGYRDPWKAIS